MPSRLGRYAVRRRIGSGAFATVWLAYDEQLDSPVAVKVLADNWTEDHHVRARFLEEGRFLRKVESPHVVSVYDAGELEDGRPYLVMSYADQGTLADRLEVDGLTAGQAFEVVRQVGLGLQALHDHGVLHRDVKPANVLFRSVDPTSAEGRAAEVRAMLGDLGLGKALDMSSRLTMIAGTPTFVAPEQAQGERLDGRADQYSLGALTFLVLTGRAPYAHTSLAAAAAPGEPPMLSVAGLEFPPEVEEVVRRALAPRPEDRWPDVTAYVSALREAIGNAAATPLPERWLPVDSDLTQPGARPSHLPPDGPLADPTPPVRPRSRRAVALLVGGFLLALVGGAAVGTVVHDRAAEGTVRVTDSTSSLEVIVPRDWTAESATGEWTPPDQDLSLPALSLGTEAGWNSAGSDAEGVFVGVLPAADMPEQLPAHAECDTVLDPVSDLDGQDPLLTQVAIDCPGVVVERVRQVAQDRYLWIQVRSSDRSTAYDVLDQVSAPGF